ncbi:hypothetical protein FOMG_16044 [Fusarium oxysporum f. sp. melonis 26406]|uniref:DUF7908 domain-containing protein n=1 Tax=Fusarium oxysporum f. sp. melonis 26406 TaxID=1089452 RepID=W9ZG41_FUSOX|nr:hypothetical protein FOMG_16044 [Fusarium oxysporum f. sp. melonis 26406]KAJ9417940.1 hypothetical protein QL093DRAFT_2639815 [Fusarium oxysporum]
MHMETRCITYLSTFLVPVSSPDKSNGRLTGPSYLQDIAGNSSVSVIQTESQSALMTVVASGTTEASTSSGFESLSVESQLTQVQPGSETPIMTEKTTSTSSAVFESKFSTVSLITSTGIIEPPGRIVIFLIREPTHNTQKRSFNRRQNTDKRFVGNGNPDTCTYAESFNLAQEQLFIDGVPFFYNGQDYTELRARPIPPVGAVTRIFITSGRLLEIRNPDVPDGAGFCLARDGTVYVTFTSGPAGCVPIILEVYDKRQCQNGRLVGLDTTTSAAETATSTSKAITSGSSTNIEGSTTMTIRTTTTTKTKTTAKDTSTAESTPISEPTTSSKASTAESSSASTSSSFRTGITTSEASTEPTVSSPVPRESSTEGVSLTTVLTLTSAVSTSNGTEESTSIKPASSETSEAGTTSSEESTSSVEPETSTVQSTTAASESETATSTDSTTLETSTLESTTLQSSTLQSTSSQSTSSESTTNRPSTTIAQTTFNSPTTTTLGATPINTDDCTGLSDPYIASNGDRFDLSCSSNVVFLSGGGSEQAGLVGCLEDCSADPGCEGVQYTKANQNCVYLVQKVGTVPNNAYDVAFRG